MRKLLYLALLGGTACAPKPASVAGETEMPGYTLVWAEEFDTGTRPDTSNWGYELGFKRNEEDQWYQKDNAFIEDGSLVIEGRREEGDNPNYVAGSEDWRTNRPRYHYTSASINTRGKHAWQYGRFEMRGRIPVGEGIWPAWWTLGVNGPWPANGEIDIMEYYDNKLLANVACQGADGRAEWYSNTFPIDSLGGEAWADRLHTWRMDWDETAIALYLDDELLNRTTLDKLKNKGGSKVDPFHQPHYMLLNLALGGRNGGPLDNARMPRRLEVDYVRVYRKQQDSSPSEG